MIILIGIYLIINHECKIKFNKTLKEITKEIGVNI